MSRYWLRARRFLTQGVLHTNDSPHAIALGVGIAMWVAFLPLIGLQTIIAIGLAALLRANKAVCIPVVWITNPFTIVPIFGACFSLGRSIISSPTGPSEVVILSDLQQHQAVGFFELAFWRDLLYRLAGYGLELWIGCIIVGVVFGVISYFAARWGVSAYRERRRRRILQRHLLQSKLEPAKVTRRGDPV
ncbi:MAG: DUF2062 domain-containing protein [Phycisphaerae bacterium]